MNIYCTYNGTSHVPLWYINESSYSWSEVRKIFPLEFIAYGVKLQIDNVTSVMNSTKYQCGFPRINILSAVGVLYVGKIGCVLFLIAILQIHFAHSKE